MKLLGSSELVSAMGRAARDRVLECFDERAIVQFQAQILEKLEGGQGEN